MSEYRKWDESRSPQWKYLLQKESSQRRKTRKEIEKERQITKREKEEYKEIVKDKRILSKKQKKGKNITRYVRGSGGVMRKVSSPTSSEPNTIMEQVKDEYRTTTQSPIDTQTQE